MTRYRQLALDERYQIQVSLKSGISGAAIAAALGRHPSTIYREIARNGVPNALHPYSARRASRRTLERRRKKSEACRKIRGELRKLIEVKLRQAWSPEQISGRLALELGVRVSHETIYQHVLRDRTGLRYCLRFAGYKHHRFKKSKVAARTALWRKLVEDRPLAANERTEVGHWERDLIEGTRGGRACMLTVVDRKTRYTRIRRVERRSSEDVQVETVAALRPFAAITKTMTNDNGVEFQRGRQFEKQLKIALYYTKPSAPWQRGTVENTNGLIRQFFRKGTNLESYPRGLEEALEDTLNHRPRKTLGYVTPHESMFGERLNLMETQSQFGLKFSRPI